MSHIDKIADLLNEEGMVGATASPTGASVAAYLGSVLEGADSDIQVGGVNGNVVTLIVNQGGVQHSYQVEVNYGGSNR